MNTEQQLLNEKAQIKAQLRGIVASAQGRAGMVSMIEGSAWKNSITRMDAINAELARLAHTQARSEAGPVMARVSRRPDYGDGENYSGPTGLETAEYRAAFERYARRNEVHAALQVGTNSEGGYLVPEEFEREIIQALTAQSAMRNLASVITTSSTRNIPIEATVGTASWVDEEGAYSESDASFDRKVLGAHKLGRIMKVSEELLADASFDLSRYISGNYARSFGAAEELAFVNGDGSGKPRGVALDSTQGVAAAGTTAITGDELIDLYYSVNPLYRSRGTWLMHDSTVRTIRKVKDTTNQYLWQPGLAGGQPDTLLGRPIKFSDAVDVLGASKKSVLFGDFSYYQIADRDGIGMQRLNELYAANGQIGFRMYRRVDGKLLVADAVKHILMHA